MKNLYSSIYPESYVDNDPALNLEIESFLRKGFNFFFLGVLNNLPKGFKHVIKKTNKDAAEVIDNATNHKALEVLYSKGSSHKTVSFTKSLFKTIWFNMNNSKAVRNRLKFVKREIKNHLKSITAFDKEINVLSIASGSSRAIVETVLEGEYLKDTLLSLTFVDKNEHAINYSKDLSTLIGHLPVKTEWFTETAGNFLNNIANKKYDIVEIVGLLDYFDDEKVIKTFISIYNILQEGGIVITANINHNKEEKFVTNVIDWPMIYRTSDELASLVNKSGFEYNKMKVFYEPLKVHGMVVAKK